MTRFINITESGVYRSDLIRSVQPFIDVRFEVEIQPPLTHEAEFKAVISKVTDIVPAISIEGESETVLDHAQNNTVTSQISFDMDELIPVLLPAPKKKGENKLYVDVSKKMKNYKIRLRKIAEYEKQYAQYDEAKGSPTYSIMMQQLKDNAPSNDGQEERVNDIREIFQDSLNKLIKKDGDLELIAAFEDSDEQVKAAANDLMNFYTNFLNGDIESSEFDGFEQGADDVYGDTDEGLEGLTEEEIKDRLDKLPPETAVSNALGILDNQDTISNKFEEDEEEDNEEQDEVTYVTGVDEDEEESEVITIAPKN